MVAITGVLEEEEVQGEKIQVAAAAVRLIPARMAARSVLLCICSEAWWARPSSVAGPHNGKGC